MRRFPSAANVRGLIGRMDMRRSSDGSQRRQVSLSPSRSDRHARGRAPQRGRHDPGGLLLPKPGTVVLTEQADANVPCVCYVVESGRFDNLGRGSCPEGLPEIKIDRNVGG